MGRGRCPAPPRPKRDSVYRKDQLRTDECGPLHRKHCARESSTKDRGSVCGSDSVGSLEEEDCFQTRQGRCREEDARRELAQQADQPPVLQKHDQRTSRTVPAG
ncbi:hypothetical protein BLNAU_15768 [Blattamonas nauphoetae]|uniref:Uncharacterized protein n=1 Tax=Blattamonas nauphoetae TaxID=2049346 RepID=A0ABQ9XF98_9EUKA|nr:hypothetical protein BLNAU_15768 [Blattamonas nauphoetae]